MNRPEGGVTGGNPLGASLLLGTGVSGCGDMCATCKKHNPSRRIHLAAVLAPRELHAVQAPRLNGPSGSEDRAFSDTVNLGVAPAGGNQGNCPQRLPPCLAQARRSW